MLDTRWRRHADYLLEFERVAGNNVEGNHSFLEDHDISAGLDDQGTDMSYKEWCDLCTLGGSFRPFLYFFFDLSLYRYFMV